MATTRLGEQQEPLRPPRLPDDCYLRTSIREPPITPRDRSAEPGPSSGPGTWVTGTFHGDALLGPPLTLRDGGLVTGLARAASPPPPPDPDSPWVFDRLDDVRLARSTTEALPADLRDVRLTDVRILHAEDDRLRLEATLHGRVVFSGEDLLPVPTADEAAREPEPREVATDEDGLVVYGPDTRAVEGTGHGAGSGASLGCAALGCVGLPAVTTVAAALWLVGGAAPFATWLGVVGGGWVLHGQVPQARQWAGRAGCLGTLGILALAGLATGVVAWLVGHAPCDPRPAWWLAPAALPLLAGLGVRWRTTLVLASAAWSYGLWLWAAVPEAACAAAPDTVDGLPVVIAWHETRDHWEEATAHDPDADLLEHATDIGGDRRISLDSALRHGDEWACEVPVHLSGRLLFEADSETWTAEAAPHLRRLGRLLRRLEQPVRIEGHGPGAGLSGVRARAVTDWLITEAGVPESRLTTQGLGDAHPVVHDAELGAYNDRIDVVVPCP